MLSDEFVRAANAASAAHGPIWASKQTTPGSNRAGNGKGAAKPKQRKKPLPEKVLKSFNTWAFKREQPTNLCLMQPLISDAIARNEPISFVLYWGKGPRCHLAQPDLACLDFLAALARRVREAYDHGAAITLIFTDTHARLNGHSLDSMREYFGAIEAVARERGFDTVWLGSLTRQSELSGLTVVPADPTSQDVLRSLSASAQKWYHGSGTPEHGALKYYEMNMIEKRAVELAFPRSIFITFNGSELRSLFPEHLPIFHMYSLRRGVSVKPWFLPRSQASNDVKRAG